jgi:signal peptidase II
LTQSTKPSPWWVPAAIAAGVVVLDRITKLYIQSAYTLRDTTQVIPRFFYIDHVENPGAGFGMLADSQSPFRVVILVGVSLLVMAAIAAMLWRPNRSGVPQSELMRTALALVFGGAMGNLWDRMFNGTVTDFLQFFFGQYEFPSFNAADSMITIGAVLLLLDLFLTRHQHAVPRQENSKLTS